MTFLFGPALTLIGLTVLISPAQATAGTCIVVANPTSSTQSQSPSPPPSPSLSPSPSPSKECAVSGTAQQLAATLVQFQQSGTFSTESTHVFTAEIAATASGTVTRACQVDVRVLQMLVLVIQKFGSVRVSDLGRPCTGSTLHCPSSAHCHIPDLAVDFTMVGGHAVNGFSLRTIELLRFLDGVLPSGSWAGQSACRTVAGDAQTFTHLAQFPDTCTHQHIDLHGAGDAPLTP